MFMDESGPNYDPPEDRSVVLGIVLCAPTAATVFHDHLTRLALDLETVFPQIVGQEWQGAYLGKRITRAQRRRTANAGKPLMPESDRSACFARVLRAIPNVAQVHAMALTSSWHSTTPKAWGKDYRLREATISALAALEAHGLVITEAYIDHGHDRGYASAFERYSQTFGGAVPRLQFLPSVQDRRLQVADLVAHAARAHRFPRGQHTKGLGTWLGSGLLGNRLLTHGGNPDHYVTQA
ncbi:MAG TPA: hypothetical protein VNB64_07775 [Solirubrobacteraceae bacterium]|nr:hypothetical protein [Solirubrobacteraceae bacterium]